MERSMCKNPQTREPRGGILKFTLFATACLAVSTFGQRSANAIVINDAAGTAAALAAGRASALAPLVRLKLGGSGGNCTGTLIDANHVLTARHCTLGRDIRGMQVFFDVDNDGSFDGFSRVSAKAEVSSATNFLLGGSDVAILTLSTPSTLTPLKIYDGDLADLVGRTVTTSGYGMQGVGSTGGSLPVDGKRWAGENVVDAVGGALDPGGVAIPFPSTNIINVDFDDGTDANNNLAPGVLSSSVPLDMEASPAPGDSGGPLLLDLEGIPLVLGVVSGGTTPNGPYGTNAFWTGLGEHKQFILDNAPGAQFVSTLPAIGGNGSTGGNGANGADVPEPVSTAMIGLGLIGLTRRNRRHAA